MEATIGVATNIKCPDDLKKLCKIRLYDDVLLVEVRHKRIITALAHELIVQCSDCKKFYKVIAETQTIEEVSLYDS